jgi:hypothetical protein
MQKGSRPIRALLVLLSLAPHLYVFTEGWRQAGPSRFLAGLLLWNLIPVGVGTGLLYSRFRWQGVGWLWATLAASAWAVWVALIRPQSSTASLIFLVLPVWSTVLVGPLGALVGALLSRRRPWSGDAA